MTVASAMRINGGVIEDLRMAVNGAAPFPIRLEDSERVLRGQTPSEEIGLRAGEVAIRDAQPLRHNDFKLPLMRNLIRRAVRGAGV
jgi:xanthine dehydrogenase YagS FAD-binding subunit